MKNETDNLKTPEESVDRVEELRSLHAEALVLLAPKESEVGAMKDLIENDESLSRSDKVRMKLNDLKPLQTELRKIKRDIKKYNEELKENGIDLEKETEDLRLKEIEDEYKRKAEERRAQIELAEAEKAEAFEQLKGRVDDCARRMIDLWKKDGGVKLSFTAVDKENHPDFKALLENKKVIDAQIVEKAQQIKAKKGSWIKFGLKALEDEMKNLQTEAFSVRKKISEQEKKHEEIDSEFVELQMQMGRDLKEFDDKERHEDFKDTFPFIGGMVRGEDAYSLRLGNLFDHYGFDYEKKK